MGFINHLGSFLCWSVILMYALWFCYLAITNLRRAQKENKLHRNVYRLALPGIAIGFILDFIVNIFILTIWMLDPPREAFVTGRMSRYKRLGKGWRYRVAVWVCENMLDVFDPSGCHCAKD